MPDSTVTGTHELVVLSLWKQKQRSRDTITYVVRKSSQVSSDRSSLAGTKRRNRQILAAKPQGTVSNSKIFVDIEIATTIIRLASVLRVVRQDLPTGLLAPCKALTS
nr:hypothetical protein CFP56_43930 [Quercus suber]